MDPLNPIMPDRDPVIPMHLLPAIQRVSPEQQRDESQEQPGREESEQAEEESFEHLLDEVVDDDYPTLAEDHTGPTVISDAVLVAGEENRLAPEEAGAASWDEQIRPERRADDDADDEPPRAHIDITA